ncbi:MAG: response regulator [Marinoscillum sp.]
MHNNYIDQLYLDRNNNVWLMTDDGVGKYSYELDVIKRYLPEQIKGRVRSMAVDDKGTLYFSLHESGILKVENGLSQKLELYDDKSGMDFSKYSITRVAICNNKLWAIVSNLGVISVDLTTNSIDYLSSEDIGGKEKGRIFSLYIDNEETIWIGSEVGVCALKQGAQGSIQIDRSLETILPKDDYLTLCKDEKSNLWVGSRQNGMYQLRKEDNKYKVERHFTPRIDEYGISHRTISKIFQEKSGLIWLGTHNGGINIFNPDGEVVRTVTRQLQESESSLSYQNVWGIDQLHDGLILIGTDSKGISILDPLTGNIKNGAIKELDNKAILSLLEDSKKRLWIGTYSHGIYLQNQDGSIENFRSELDGSELEVNDIRCFHEHADGTIFIGTNQGGLYYYDEKIHRIVQLEGVGIEDIRSIATSPKGDLWLGTYGHGLIKLTSSTESNRIVDGHRISKGSSEIIFDIYQDKDLLWVATRHNGLIVFDLTTEQFIDVPALGVIGDKSISNVQKDNGQKLWITTDTDIYSFHLNDSTIESFGVEDGFQSGHFNFGSAFISDDGYVVFGGIHGMNLFYPEELSASPSEYGIVLNEIKVFDQSVNPTNSDVFPKGNSIFLTDKIVLDYSDNVFSIKFSQPGFSTKHQHDFVFMLEGYERNWQLGAESNVATYRNVPPGEYSFRVKSLKNSAEKQILVSITPPIWRTWQAFVLYLLVIMFVIWKLNKFSNSRIVLRQKLEFEKELREKEHAVMQEKLRFYTNFSHELKTPLTLIQGPVNDLIMKVQNPEQLQYLKLIRKNTGIILKFIRRMLEFRKIEMNKTILNIAKHDIKILAQEEAESFGYLAKEKEVKFGFYCENELEAWVDLEKVQIIMTNLLSNAFKFTPKGRAINFGVFEADSHLIIEVKDEGVGIQKHELDNIFSPFFQASNSYTAGGTGIGLALCKNFVELHLGKISVESEFGQGSRFMVSIPKDKSELEKKDYVRIIPSSSNDFEHFTDQSSEADKNDVEFRENEKLMLVVDDNKDISLYIKTMFQHEFNVVRAENGLDALDLAVKNTPDIIISDIMMPGMDGVEFCEKIKANISTSHIPLIMLTAKDTKEDKINGYKTGADDYITKPFASEVLVARVSNLLKSREMLELKYESSDLIDPTIDQNSREVEFVLNAEKIILEKLEQSDFSVPILCKELGMSQSALYRKIKSLTGVSIQVFIRKIRIKRAAQLLLSEDMTVTEIAFALDFADLKYFRKCFKDQFGINPSEYKVKNSVKNDDIKIEVDYL